MKKYRIIKYIQFDEYAKESHITINVQEWIKKISYHYPYKLIPFLYKEKEYWDWEDVGRNTYSDGYPYIVPTKFDSLKDAEDFINRISEGIIPNSYKDEVLKEIEL